MRKLLRANAARIRMSGMFWGGMICWIALCLLDLLDSYSRAVEYEMPLPEIFQGMMFSHTTIMGILFSILVSLAVGTEYSDGTIRNKLIVGQSRSSIYLSNYTACTAAALIQTAAAVITVLGIGFPVMGKPELETVEILQVCAVLVFLCMSYVAVYNLVSMLVSSKSYASVINILLAFAFLFCAAYLSSRLAEPEMMTDYSFTVNGGLVAGNEVPNPNYVSGMQRDIYQFLIDFLPGGQNMQAANSGLLDQLLKHPALSCFYSAVIAAACNFAGVILFERKDIK